MNRPKNENAGTNKNGPSMTDAELVLAARRGDKWAFVEIVARHQAMVCGIALGIIGDFAASEDAAQEAFLTAWRKFHDLREPERLRSWLGQIARNAALGYLRRDKRHEPLVDELSLVDESPSPDEAAATQEEVALVQESLGRLPETYRLPLILFYREGKSVSSVAEALQISEDAVKQRLSRGREMLRDHMSGVIETVLTRTVPKPIFTMAVAAAIGALAAPAAIAATAFAAAPVAVGAASSGTWSTSLFTAMSTSKNALMTAAAISIVCIPVGYHVSWETEEVAPISHTVAAEAPSAAAAPKARPSFESSALFAEWRQLHETHGTTSEAMPVLYKAISEMSDSFRRRAFRTALIAEWVQVDPKGGLEFFREKGRDASQARQFFEEWLARDANAAVSALMTTGPGWEGLARETLTDIARRVPERVPEIAGKLPKTDNYWDTKVRDAFAIVAEHNLASARNAAEGISGPSREQALTGVAKEWGKRDLDGAVAWAKGLPDGVDRNEVIRGALLGKAVVDPAAALEKVTLVPSGGRDGYFAVSTGARVLSEAAKVDFEGTMAWITSHPGRLGREDMHGIARAVTDRLNQDAAGFLNSRMGDGSLDDILPAIDSAILNDASGQRAAIWEWLKNQPDSAASQQLRQSILNSAAWQDPDLALKLAGDLPQTAEGDQQVHALANSLFNGGTMLYRLDNLLQQAPERLRQPLIQTAFNQLNPENMRDPQAWISRLSQLPEGSRPRGVESIARAWAGQSPEEAIGWVSSLAAGDARSAAVASAVSGWATQDPSSAASWVGSLNAGLERDQSAQSLVMAIADKHPREAWEWALSIGDATAQANAAIHAARMLAQHDRAAAQQLVQTSALSPEIKARIKSALESRQVHGHH